MYCFRLAFEWDVENFERFEPELPEYKRRQIELNEYLKYTCGSVGVLIFKYIVFLKRLFSFFITLMMVRLKLINKLKKNKFFNLMLHTKKIGLVCADIAASVLYRVYIGNVLFANNSNLKLIVGTCKYNLFV